MAVAIWHIRMRSLTVYEFCLKPPSIFLQWCSNLCCHTATETAAASAVFEWNHCICIMNVGLWVHKDICMCVLASRYFFQSVFIYTLYVLHISTYIHLGVSVKECMKIGALAIRIIMSVMQNKKEKKVSVLVGKMYLCNSFFYYFWCCNEHCYGSINAFLWEIINTYFVIKLKKPNFSNVKNSSRGRTLQKWNSIKAKAKY